MKKIFFLFILPIFYFPLFFAAAESVDDPTCKNFEELAEIIATESQKFLLPLEWGLTPGEEQRCRYHFNEQKKHLMQARALLAQGALLNTKDADGKLTCATLKLALYDSNVDLFVFLLQKGAMPDPSLAREMIYNKLNSSREGLTLDQEIQYRSYAREKLPKQIIELLRQTTSLGNYDTNGPIKIIGDYYGSIEDDQELIEVVGMREAIDTPRLDVMIKEQTPISRSSFCDRCIIS